MPSKMSDIVSVTDDFVQEVVSSVQEAFRQEVEEYAEDFKKRFVTQTMNKINNVRCEVVRAIGSPGLEFRIVVQATEEKK